MSPILVRPVREQFEHDRVIRLLHARSTRKYDAGINPGAQQNVPVSTGGTSLYPDLVLASLDRGRKIEVIIEVETGESVNHLEALAQWAHFARLRPAFHLYVPSAMVDVAKRLCEDNNIVASEIWSYHGIGDEVRFTLVDRAREATSARRRTPVSGAAPARGKARPAAPARSASRPSERPAARPTSRPASRPSSRATARPTSRPSRAVKAAPRKKTAKTPPKAKKRK